MTSSAAQDLVNQTSELIAGARSLVAFTGAGISTPSGIPDFRSAGSGLWTRSDPMAVASLTAFHRRPEVFFNWLRPLARKIALASPNPAHRALGALESAGILKAVITQNIDGLHQRGGNKNVIEIHGSLDRWICMNCREEYPSSGYLGLFLDEEINPACPRCNSLLKPGITLFEEMLPVEAWETACDLSAAAD
jgi:NAD-dependent deacetylase